MNERKDDLRASWSNVKAYARLYLENLKLLSAEKLTLLLSQTALAALLAMLAMIAFFFISIGLVFLLAQALPIMWSCMIMGAIYLIIGLIVILMRKQLLMDPIARFISRLILHDPVSNRPDTTSTPEEQ